MSEQWIAAYYPSELISNPHSRAIMGLLFDKIVCHFPVSGMSCGGGSGVYDILLEDDALYEAGILEPREETLYSDIGANLSWNDEFEKYQRLQITAMTMDMCRVDNIVPVTDDPSWPIPASLLQNFDLPRFAHLQASALAIQSLKIALPPIATLSDLDILKAREELIEQLIPFRNAMLALSPTVRSGIESTASISDIYGEAQYIVDTQISPALSELKRRLAIEKGTFWRRLILKGSAIVPEFLLNWTTKNGLEAAIKAVDGMKDLTLDIIDRDNLLKSLKNEGGLGFLLSVTENPNFKVVEKKR